MERLYGFETVAKALFIVSFFVGSSYSLVLALAACVLAVYRRLQRIEFSRAYLGQVLQNEYGSNILFILSFSSVNKSIFFYAPLTLHFLTGISQYIQLAHKDNTFVIRYLSKYVDIIRNNRRVLLAAKAKIEFIYLPVAIILTFFDFGRLISTLIYGQYILLRTRLGGDFTSAIGELDNQLLPYIQRIGLSGVYDKIKGFMLTVKNKFG